jgi:hypothetical protein
MYMRDGTYRMAVRSLDEGIDLNQVTYASARGINKVRIMPVYRDIDSWWTIRVGLRS